MTLCTCDILMVHFWLSTASKYAAQLATKSKPFIQLMLANNSQNLHTHHTTGLCKQLLASYFGAAQQLLLMVLTV